MTADFIVLDAGTIFAQNRSQGVADQKDFNFIDIYSLGKVDLTPYKCLVITGFSDQDFLYKERHAIREFLEDRKVVVFCGNLVTNWLPGGKPFIAKDIKRFSDYRVRKVIDHPIFRGVEEDDMTLKKGVAGFFARGHHPLPTGAEVLLTLNEGEPITYIDRHSTSGTILAHVGFDLFGYMQTDEKKTTDRISAQLRSWVLEEVAALQEGAVKA